MSTAKSIICFFFEHNLPKTRRLSLSRLPHTLAPSQYLRAWNRLVDTRHIELKEEPKVKHLNWLTCNFASCRKRTQTSGSFICRFGLHWFRADYNVCDGKKLFRPSSSVFMGSFNSYKLFSALLSIIPDFPIKPCYYPLFTFHPQTWYNQLLKQLITH